MELVEQWADASWLRGGYAASARRVCGLMGMAVSSYRYGAKRCDGPLRTQLMELAREEPRFGYRRLHVLLRRGGERVNHKRVHRVYRKAGLSSRGKKRKHCVRIGQRCWHGQRRIRSGRLISCMMRWSAGVPSGG
jgi:putative transposase